MEKNKVAIITGAGRGIGKAIAIRLSKESYNLVLCSRTEKEIENVARECRNSGVEAIGIVADVRKEEDVKKVVKEAIKKFGKIDVLINNAGIGYAKPIVETKKEDWDIMMETNARGTFLFSREVFKEMVRNKIKGTIINISSMAGKKPYKNQSAYCASKFAIVGFSKVLAVEAQEYGIKVHVICPGGVDTDFIKNIRPDIPSHTLIKPEDIAETVIFLLKTRKEITVDEILIRRYESQVI